MTTETLEKLNMEGVQAEDAMEIRDYSLTGPNAKLSKKRKLTSADWYQSPIEPEIMEELLVRKNGPAIRDTVIWFGVLIGTGVLGAMLWGSAWAIIPFFIYSVFYASSSDSRWHESVHGTAFKTDVFNNILYEIASFMVFRESTPWRWSHMRHHSDTIIVGRDPEIAYPRPPKAFDFVLGFFAVKSTWATLKNMCLHATGKLTDAEMSYIPKSEHGKVVVKSRIYLAIYVGVLATALATQSWLPLMYVGIPTFIGSWLMVVYGTTQHAGLAENVLDHRLNCRTVHMNLLNRYLYWNMGFHVEHHMFPLVPYHQLPKLHSMMLSDTPKPYASLWQAWKEIIPALILQIDHPELYVKRELPESAKPSDWRAAPKARRALGEVDSDGWVEIEGPAPMLERVIRFDYQKRSYAIYRSAEGQLFATHGICTHGNTHLSEGVVMGNQIECAKHNGRFDIRDGSCKRAPACVAIKTFPVRETEGRFYLQVKPVQK